MSGVQEKVPSVDTSETPETSEVFEGEESRSRVIIVLSDQSAVEFIPDPGKGLNNAKQKASTWLTGNPDRTAGARAFAARALGLAVRVE